MGAGFTLKNGLLSRAPVGFFPLFAVRVWMKKGKKERIILYVSHSSIMRISRCLAFYLLGMSFFCPYNSRENTDLLTLGVECRCCLVQKKYTWISDQSTCYCNTLLLTTRQLSALTTKPCIVSLKAGAARITVNDWIVIPQCKHQMDGKSFTKKLFHEKWVK